MIKIYLLRHEEAVNANEVGGLDRDRVLTKAGEQSVTASARGMVKIGVRPDFIWTSPYARALQTAKLAAAELDLSDRVSEHDELAQGADLREIAKLIESEAGDGSTVMLVGHNPDFERLASWLISGRSDANVNLKKGSLALIHADLPMHPGCGSLRWLLIPPQMAQFA